MLSQHDSHLPWFRAVDPCSVRLIHKRRALGPVNVPSFIMKRYQLSIEAEDLSLSTFWTRWITGKPSQAYAEVLVNGGPHQGTIIGRTESHTGRRIQWVKTLFVETDPSIYMPLTIRVYMDNGSLLGEMTAEAMAIHQSAGRVRREETPSGIMYVPIVRFYAIIFFKSYASSFLELQYLSFYGRVSQRNLQGNDRPSTPRTRYKKLRARFAWSWQIRPVV